MRASIDNTGIRAVDYDRWRDARGLIHPSREAHSIKPLSSRGPGHHPFKVETRVRIPLGVPSDVRSLSVDQSKSIALRLSWHYALSVFGSSLHHGIEHFKCRLLSKFNVPLCIVEEDAPDQRRHELPPKRSISPATSIRTTSMSRNPTHMRSHVLSQGCGTDDNQ